ncbi:unnamed protein product [Prorocentrum cordatum]|uniref:MBL fold metallo-hydrolase n=1 Tax=Prorocentrum cordatum TaxID=2364126 RepID=A0ABN9X9P4_9DINO|nr:unnamed protein product [Polarella glacialis]
MVIALGVSILRAWRSSRPVTPGAALALGADAYLRASDERYASFGTILAPAPFKETLRTELVPGQIWGFEQCIALLSVSTNIRMTAVRLRDGRLWVSAPISPTRQCLRELDELGEVAHLVVPSTALEHKASLAEFARIYPRAAVWVAPGQEAQPLPMPAGSRVLGQGPEPPWAEELPYKVFYVAPPVTDTFAEVAFLHRDSGTLLVTDCALKLSQAAPKILESYGYDGTPGPISPEQWRYKAIPPPINRLRLCDRAGPRRGGLRCPGSPARDRQPAAALPGLPKMRRPGSRLGGGRREVALRAHRASPPAGAIRLLPGSVPGGVRVPVRQAELLGAGGRAAGVPAGLARAGRRPRVLRPPGARCAPPRGRPRPPPPFRPRGIVEA